MKLIITDPLNNSTAWNYALSMVAADEVMYILPNVYEQSIVLSTEEPEDSFFMLTGVSREFITEADMEMMVVDALYFYPADALDERTTDDIYFEHLCQEEENKRFEDGLKLNVRPVDKKVIDWIAKFGTDEDTNCVMKNFKQSWNPEVYFENYWIRR